ncbi:MAG: CRTAC1 family protein [Bacteroidales bacterium]|nr:CRTAC1 family protein [Bacteroidales bacterium]
MRFSFSGFILSTFLAFQLAGLQAQRIEPFFTDMTKLARIDFKYTIGDDHYENILESSGSGITIFDYNGDGWMDLYMMNGTYIEGISDLGGIKYKDTPDRLYKNNGNGSFTEVSGLAGLDDRNWSMAAGAIDIDNDGDQDLYLLNYGPNRFFRNNGNDTFTDITDRVGLKGPDKLNGFTKWSIGVSYFDYNRDGRLDAFVGNFLAFDPKYVSTETPGMMPHPSEYMGQASMLYEQKSDGSFVDVTKKAGLYYPDSKCMGLTVFDYDEDGDLDIFQANDHQLNFLFRNTGGKFKEVGIASGVAANTKGNPCGSMHGTLGDVDGDGLIDILVTDLEYGAFYKNTGGGVYKDISESSGVAGFLMGKGGWGSELFDYDNDGDLDIVSANGTAEELVLQHPLLLENDGNGHYKNVGPSRAAYFSTKRSGRGVTVWDYDNDGDMDIIFSHVDKQATATLLRNNTGNRNHWVGFTLKGANGPASAIAAKVEITAGGKKQVRINQWTTSYLSNKDPRIHFGLGNHKLVERIEITWSDGKKEIYNNIGGDRYLTIVQGKGIILK